MTMGRERTSGLLDRMSPTVQRLYQDVSRNAEARLRFPRTRAARAVTFAVLGLPVAWLLGLAEFAWPLLVLPMAVVIFTGRRLLMPKAFLIWLAFVGLALVAAISAGGGLHMTTVYLSGTVIFLFAYNATTDELPDGFVVALVAIYWLVLIGGGVLGLIVGTTEFPSLGNALVAGDSVSGSWLDEVTLVQFSDVLKEGEVEGLVFDFRPKGFVAYANDWGSSVVMLLPALVLLRMSLRKGRLSRVLDFGVVAAVAPFVISRNRWAWVSLLVLLLYAIVRLWAPQPRIARAIMAGLLTALVVVAFTPLGGIVVDRLEGESSNQFRSEQYRLSWELIQTSPWLGFGVNQASEDSVVANGVEYESIELGADSQILQTTVNHGIPALSVLGLWLVVLIVVTRSMPTASAAFVHLAAIVALIHSPFYMLMPHRWMFLMLLAGAALRQLPNRGASRALVVWSRFEAPIPDSLRARRRPFGRFANKS